MAGNLSAIVPIRVSKSSIGDYRDALTASRVLRMSDRELTISAFAALVSATVVCKDRRTEDSCWSRAAGAARAVRVTLARDGVPMTRKDVGRCDEGREPNLWIPLRTVGTCTVHCSGPGCTTETDYYCLFLKKIVNIACPIFRVQTGLVHW